MDKIKPKKILIKGMLKTSFHDERRLRREFGTLADEGADIIRVAALTDEDLRLIPRLKALGKNVLIESDIHFNYRLALAALARGADIVRLNPLNITSPSQVKAVIRAARQHRATLRIGINSGGFRRAFASEKSCAGAMVGAMARYLDLFEKEKFYDIILSLKSPLLLTTSIANREADRRFPYPLDVGITSSGPYIEGIVKSAIGISRILHLKKVESMRVSLSAPSYMEVRVARYILQSAGYRKGLEIITCPTCSRCKVDLMAMVDRFKKKLADADRALLERSYTVALMGCEVNGPGEAAQADMGIACGANRAVLFCKGTPARTIPLTEALDRLLAALIKKAGPKK